eukprot:gene10524-14139_t
MRRSLLLTVSCVFSSFNRTFQSIALEAGVSFSKKRSVTLITFDVDGTLVQGSSAQAEVSAHARAFMHAAGRILKNNDNFEKVHPSPLAFVPPMKYHGCTDGLIMLNIAKYAFNISSELIFPKLPELFQCMYEYVAKLSDEEMAKGIAPLPGVMNNLIKLGSDPILKDHVLCGLVTGNVEGIARKKMRATGILQTKALSRKSHLQTWNTENDASFLGGFGSDYCSGDIENSAMIYRDRGEQIVIAYNRAKSLLKNNEVLVRVVHVGDAPADILAIKMCAEENRFDSDVKSIGCIGVATGKFSADQLKELAGQRNNDIFWNPIVLADGMNDPSFIESCGIIIN